MTDLETDSDANSCSFAVAADAADASYFESRRRGEKAPKPRGRGLTTDQLMKFFTGATWSGYDDNSTVRPTFTFRMADPATASARSGSGSTRRHRPRFWPASDRPYYMNTNS